MAHVLNTRSCCQCTFLCKYICSRQSRRALGRFHRVDRENFHKDSGREKQIRVINITRIICGAFRTKGSYKTFTSFECK